MSVVSDEKAAELYQGLQYIEQLISQLQSNLEAVSREIIVVKQAKDSVEGITKSEGELLLPLDAKSYTLGIAEKVDKESILVRVSSRYYVKASPSEALLILDEEEKRLLKIADDIRQRIAGLVEERRKLQAGLAELVQKSQSAIKKGGESS
ncbi:MAG: hypothetical protein LRS47_01405 [Desulfurococcales archaeon]|nr:hypothetical protein [Desulfurococcales archaeon]